MSSELPFAYRTRSFATPTAPRAASSASPDAPNPPAPARPGRAVTRSAFRGTRSRAAISALTPPTSPSRSVAASPTAAAAAATLPFAFRRPGAASARATDARRRAATTTRTKVDDEEDEEEEEDNDDAAMAVASASDDDAEEEAEEEEQAAAVAERQQQRRRRLTGARPASPPASRAQRRTHPGASPRRRSASRKRSLDAPADAQDDLRFALAELDDDSSAPAVAAAAGAPSAKKAKPAPAAAAAAAGAAAAPALPTKLDGPALAALLAPVLATELPRVAHHTGEPAVGAALNHAAEAFLAEVRSWDAARVSALLAPDGPHVAEVDWAHLPPRERRLAQLRGALYEFDREARQWETVRRDCEARTLALDLEEDVRGGQDLPVPTVAPTFNAQHEVEDLALRSGAILPVLKELRGFVGRAGEFAARVMDHLTRRGLETHGATVDPRTLIANLAKPE